MTNDSHDQKPEPFPTRDFWRLQEQVRGIGVRMDNAEQRHQQREVDVDRRFERLEAKVEIIPIISTQLAELKDDMKEIGIELHTYITSVGVNRRGEWSLAGQFGALMVSVFVALIAAGGLIVTFLHTKGGP